MMSKNWRLASSENPLTSLVTLWRMCGSGVAALPAIASRIISRVRFSISGSERNIFARSDESVTYRPIAVCRIVPRSCEQLGSAVSGHTAMHSMHCVQFSAM